MEFPIDLQDVGVSYRGRAVLQGLDLKVRAGEISGFIGPNGAGKTTTIKAILGLVVPSRGRVLLNGLPPSDARSRRTVGFLPEETTYYRYLNSEEILSFYGRFFGLAGAELQRRIGELIALVGLEAYRRKPVGQLSKGTAQKIGLAQALVNDPDVLILDEPMSGLDPLSRLGLRSILSGLKKRGKTVFFSSHELSEVELICDSLAIVNEGRVIRSGPIKNVLESTGEKSLEQFYLHTIRGGA